MSDPKKQIWLLRHAATEWSVNGRHTGVTDLPLLPEGEAVARRLRPVVDAHRFDLVLCSPLQRARRTAELLGIGDAAVIDDDLHEWDYGDYEGITTKVIRETLVWRTLDPRVLDVLLSRASAPAPAGQASTGAPAGSAEGADARGGADTVSASGSRPGAKEMV